MNLTFDPSNQEDCAIVARILDTLHGDDGAASHVHMHTGVQIDTSAPHLTVGAEADTRDPAAAFGASAAPLPMPGAPQIADALQSFSAPGALPAGVPNLPTAAQLPAAGALATGAPSAPAATPNPAGGVELDNTGLPWDVRIHASTKSKTKDGSWTKLRGFNDETKRKAIEAEIRATMALPLPGASVQPPLPGVAPLAAPMNGPASSAVPAQPAVTLPPSSPPAMQAAPNAVPASFDELMPRITAAVGKTIPEGALEWAIGQHGMQSPIALLQRPDFVPAVWATLTAQYPALQ